MDLKHKSERSVAGGPSDAGHPGKLSGVVLIGVSTNREGCDAACSIGVASIGVSTKQKDCVAGGPSDGGGALAS